MSTQRNVSSEDGYDYNSEDDGEGDDFVWDVPNPFAPPDPSQAHLHSLIQAQIAQMRRYESVGPFQSLPGDQVHLDYWDESESDGEDVDDEDYEDEDSESDDDDDYDDSSNDGDDGDDEDSDDSDADSDDADKPNVIVLPKLLPIPLCFFPSPQPNLPPPSPSSDTASTSTSTSDDDDPTLWADLAQVYNDIAEAEERAARKAKRDAYRSRLKALALLGPET